MILPEAGWGVIFGIADHSPAETKASNRCGTHVEELKSRATRLTASTGTATFDLKLERKVRLHIATKLHDSASASFDDSSFAEERNVGQVRRGDFA